MVLRKLIPLVLVAVLPIETGASVAAASALRDGSHDFDFERGTWRIHIHRLLHPLTGSTQWSDYDGTKTDIPVWNGKASLAEVNATGSAGRLHFIALRLYDPTAHQWNLNFASAGNGSFGTPLYGEKRGGAIEFIGPDTLDGRSILVRFVIQADGRGKASSRQYFSADGGKTWELNWINSYTRTKG